jgi:hypothetical protein
MSNQGSGHMRHRLEARADFLLALNQEEAIKVAAAAEKAKARLVGKIRREFPDIDEARAQRIVDLFREDM